MLKPFLIIVFRYLTRSIVNVSAIIISWFSQEGGKSRLIVRVGLGILSFFFAKVAVFAFSLVILAIYLVFALASCCQSCSTSCFALANYVALVLYLIAF